MSTHDGTSTAPVHYGHGFHHGLLGRVVELHGLYYGPTWNLGLAMELDMARGLAELAARYDANRDRILWARLDERVVGSLTVDGIDGDGERGAKLRWFILETGLHGRGIGGELISRAVDFCRERGYRRIHLHTFAELAAAITLYRRHGFRDVEIRPTKIWQTEVDIIEMACDL